MARECVTAKLQASPCRLNQLKLEESRSARTLERAGGGFGAVPSSRSLRVAFEPVKAGWEAFDRSIAMASESVGKSADISYKSATFHFFQMPFLKISYKLTIHIFRIRSLYTQDASPPQTAASKSDDRVKAEV